jgi:hypothetical protein
VPSVVQRVLVQPPASRLGPVSAEERRAILAASPIGARYDKAVDRESAFELLNQRARAAAGNEAGDAAPPAGAPDADYAEPSARSERAAPRPRGREREGMMEMMAKSVVRTIGSSIGREIIRGVLGSFLRRR